MSEFDLDAQVTTPATPVGGQGPASITPVITKTPVCSKATCQCTIQGGCTAWCR